jgi:hypothetical protein
MSKLQVTLDAFDAANSEDPNLELVDGQPQPKELIYGRRMSQRLQTFCPDATEPLQLAARCQHIRRWDIPRSDYPMDRTGYKRWRSQLAVYHGEVAGRILAHQGYDDATIERVKYLLQKRGLKRDPEVQTLEDVICLVFIEYYLEDFAHKHDEAKLLDIIRKTWHKMSDTGHDAALKLPLSPGMQTLVGKALAP